MSKTVRIGVLLALSGCGASSLATAVGEPLESSSVSAKRSLVLISLDTTRADSVGPSAPGARSTTPVLDALAARGVRYLRAVTPSPLTLPAHASIMTGLEPPEHGVRTNGTSVLATEIPTLASVLSQSGYSTAAFVSSRVLDHRFGLDRGFDLYGDRMTAERTGEYGYAERDASAVTSASISWLDSAAVRDPFFLWVHYYDPHFPYEPPGVHPSAAIEERYQGEIAYMDREIGRLLNALSQQSSDLVIAVVGDHGESLGEHGERGHGIFLYGASLDVPLVIAGPGVPAGRVVESRVSVRRLAATVLELLEPLPGTPAVPGPLLPGIFDDTESSAAESRELPVYSETRLPATAYGWAPLRSVSDSRWRLIEAPRPELYDLESDPGETRNVLAQNPDEAQRLRRHLRRLESTMATRAGQPAGRDPALDAALRRLGYLESGGGEGTLDPKDGIHLLGEFEEAKALAVQGELRKALMALQGLVRRNPGNVPFLTHLAEAQLASGEAEAAIATYKRAIRLNPGLEFLHLNLAAAYRRLGRTEAARRELEAALQIDPRSSVAWLKLAEAAHDEGLDDAERRLLERAVEAGTTSAVVHNRLGQIAAAKTDFPTAARHFDQAIELIPGWISPLMGRAEAAERSSRFAEARASYRSAAQLDPRDPAPLMGLARLHREAGELRETRHLLEQVLNMAPQSPEAGEARTLLAELAEH